MAGFNKLTLDVDIRCILYDGKQMRLLSWDEAKNTALRKKYGIGFEEIVEAISSGNLIADVEHPKRRNQKMLIVTVNDYVYVVPYISNTGFLKTFWPSRKAKKEYMGD